MIIWAVIICSATFKTCIMSYEIFNSKKECVQFIKDHPGGDHEKLTCVNFRRKND